MEDIIIPSTQVLTLKTCSNSEIIVVYNCIISTIRDLFLVIAQNEIVSKIKYFQLVNSDKNICIDNQESMTLLKDLTSDPLVLNLKPIPKDKKIKAKSPANEIVIIVVDLVGKKTIINIDPSKTVHKIKKIIQEKQGIPPDQQRLIFAGRMLEDHQSLSSITIQSGATFHLVLRLRGGMYDQTSGKTGNFRGETVAAIKTKIIYLNLSPDAIEKINQHFSN